MSASPALAWRNNPLARFAFAMAVVCVVGTVAFAQAGSSGSIGCSTCHVGVVRNYSHAPMRHAMEPEGANPPLAAHPALAVQLNGYSYTVQTKDGHSTYTVSDGHDSLTLPIRWIFGQRAQTWVLEKDGRSYESLVSYFPRENALGTTPGDDRIKPHNLTEAMGRELASSETLHCFDCHATNATAGLKLTLDKLTPGLDCERCHVGAQQHMADAIHDNFKTVPQHLRRMNADETSNFCGQCHRTWETVVRNHWKGPAFVRFQPYRLQNSKCFIGNDPRISCIACHDPHQPASHDQAYYDAKCGACHSASHPSVKATAGGNSAPETAKSCPVGKANCVGCHMPKVELPGGHATFTDHQIRIVHPGDPYPN